MAANGRAIGVALVALALAGCSDRAVAVRGKVTYQGKPLAGGSVTLVGPTGLVYAGAVQADGTYTIDGVPAGSVKIGVTGPPNRSAAKPAPGGRDGGRGGDVTSRGAPDGAAPAPPPPAPTAGPSVSVPAQFADPNASGLTGTVESGKPLDIDVK